MFTSACIASAGVLRSILYSCVCKPRTCRLDEARTAQQSGADALLIKRELTGQYITGNAAQQNRGMPGGSLSLSLPFNYGQLEQRHTVHWRWRWPYLPLPLSLSVCLITVIFDFGYGCGCKHEGQGSLKAGRLGSVPVSVPPWLLVVRRAVHTCTGLDCCSGCQLVLCLPQT